MIVEVVAFVMTGRKVAEWSNFPQDANVAVNLEGMTGGLFVFRVKN
jgi:hypothetical protein